jgi:6-phosphogluconolactonase
VATSRGPNDSCEKAHQAVFDETGGHVYVPCLGSNYVMHFTFSGGQLGYGEPATVTVMGGPRHMALHPTAPYAYVLSELESTLTRFAYDRTTGQLSAPASIPSFDARAGSSAHIVVHPSGKFLYVSNRTENSLGLFSIDAATGTPSPVSFETAMISTPRDFAVDPTGRILISANQAGAQDLLVYRLDPSDGQMTRLRAVPVGGRPSFVGFVSLP